MLAVEKGEKHPFQQIHLLFGEPGEQRVLENAEREVGRCEDEKRDRHDEREKQRAVLHALRGCLA